MNLFSLALMLVWIIASLLILVFLALDVDPVFRLYYSNILQIVSAFLSSFFCYRTATSLPGANPMRTVWWLLGTGLLSWGLGAVIYSTYPLLNNGQETPFPYYSDIGYLALIPFAVAALLSFKKILGVVSPVWGKILAVLLFLGGLYISTMANWNGLFSEGLISPLVSVSYMLFDPILLMVVMLVASGLSGGAASGAGWFIMIGLVLYFIGDQAYTYLVFTKQYASGSPIDIFWILGFAMIAVAAMLTHSLFKGNR